MRLRAAFVTIFCSLMANLAYAQNSSEMLKTLKIGDSIVQIVQAYGKVGDNTLFINVHEDETTSIESLEHYSKENPVHFVRLKHNETRRIDFSINSQSYSVDPNRIFTRKGRKKTLKDGGKFSFKASKSVKLFANEVLSYIKDSTVVVAMHNNTDVNYSIKSYLPGGDESQNTKEVYVNEEMDPDDFIYTTDKTFFDALKEKKINVILQDNKKFVNDGSLSVHCGVNGIRYINIEAQKGHFDEQLRLIEVVASIL